MPVAMAPQEVKVGALLLPLERVSEAAEYSRAADPCGLITGPHRNRTRTSRSVSHERHDPILDELLFWVKTEKPAAQSETK